MSDNRKQISLFDKVETETQKALRDAKSIFNEYNTLIRNFLRDTMGVKLEDRSDINSRGAIQVEIREMPEDPKLNQAIQKVLDSFDLNKYSKIKSLRDSLKVTSFQFRNLDQESSHKILLDYCESYLNEHDLNALLKYIIDEFSIEPFHSPFGVYNLVYSRVTLYIRPIHFYCKAKSLDFKTFIVLVLAHELAHGYSHIGLDKDRQKWENLWHADLDIAEGIAQYYARRFLLKYQNRLSDGLEVFDTLLEDQADCYRAYQKWEVTDEQLYRAFVELRRNGQIKTEDFIKLIEASKKAIK